jgi:hypothetical protein
VRLRSSPNRDKKTPAFESGFFFRYAILYMRRSPCRFNLQGGISFGAVVQPAAPFFFATIHRMANLDSIISELTAQRDKLDNAIWA